MASYLIGHMTVKDEELWQHYVAGVKDSLSAFESNVIFRGKLVSTLAGSHVHDRVVVIEFANHETLDEWTNRNGIARQGRRSIGCQADGHGLRDG